MDVKRLLITGGTGFLGSNLSRGLAGHGHKITTTYNRQMPVQGLQSLWMRMDLSKAVPPISDDAGFDAIIHCAAISDLQVCDQDHRMAHTVNAEGTRQLAALSRKLGIPFFYVSTDLVFDGTHAPYREDDEPSPTSYYAETKLLGERNTAVETDYHYILRTALMYGPGVQGYGSFLSWTVADLRAGNQLKLYTNQFRNPLYAPDVGVAIEFLLQYHAPFGIYHLGGPQRYSRYEIGCKVAASIIGSIDGIDEALSVRPGHPEFVDDTTLDTGKIQREAHMAFTSFAEGLSRTKQFVAG